MRTLSSMLGCRLAWYCVAAPQAIRACYIYYLFVFIIYLQINIFVQLLSHF